MSTKGEEPGATALGFKPQMIGINALEFDPASPRTVERLGRDASQPKIEEFLLGGEMKAAELVPSFMESGYIPHEPLIVKQGERAGTYVVVEGNRRLAALRLMRDSGDDETKAAFNGHKLSQAPCLVFEGTENQLLAYLGLRHLSKTKDWTNAAKGAFVERLLRASSGTHRPDERLKEAARLTNTTTSALRLIMLARRMFQQAEHLGFSFGGGGAEPETVFWHLGDALRRSNTKAYLKLIENPDPMEPPEYDEDRFEKLVGWLYGNPKTKQVPLISSIRDIPDLNTCLGNAQATRSLEAGDTLKEAMEALEAAGAMITVHLERGKKAIQRATTVVSELKNVERDGVTAIQNASGEVRDALDQFEGGLKLRLEKIAPEKTAASQ